MDGTAKPIYVGGVRIANAIRTKLQRYGAWNVLFVQSLKTLHALAGLKVLRGVWIERPDRSFLECPPGYTQGFLTADRLRKYARDPASEISREFLEQAFNRADACYALCAGNELAAYGWYSTMPTPIGVGDRVLHFDRRYVYMYKGFTDMRHRGRRLHAIGMSGALERYRARGYKGLVSYVGRPISIPSSLACAWGTGCSDRFMC